jgi:glutathione S-transferase
MSDHQPELQLIGGPVSNYVWVCRIALTEKHIPYTLQSVMPHTPNVDAIHPLGKIPVMRHGDVTLFESRAICHYIDHAFTAPTLAPADPIRGAQTEQWISLINTAFDPLWVRTYFREYIFPTGPDGTSNRAAIDNALPKMAPQFATMDRAVGDTGYLVGADFTLADAFFLPILHYMSTVPEGADLIARSANLTPYLALHMDRPSVKATLPPSWKDRAAA